MLMPKTTISWWGAHTVTHSNIAANSYVSFTTITFKICTQHHHTASRVFWLQFERIRFLVAQGDNKNPSFCSNICGILIFAVAIDLCFRKNTSFPGLGRSTAWITSAMLRFPPGVTISLHHYSNTQKTNI